MKKIHLISCLSLLSVYSSFADSATSVCTPKQSNTLDFIYTVNKTTFSEFYRNQIVIIKGEGLEDTINPTFTWGEQGQVVWTKRFKDTGYAFVGGILGLHNSFEKHFECGPGQSVRGNGLNVNGEGSSFQQRDQFNLFELDLFVKADLKQTKHACFAVYGGTIIAGFGARSEAFAKNPSQASQQSSMTQFHDYFLGPNIKIGVTSPFLDNRLIFDVRAGMGYIMTFCSYSKMQSYLIPPFPTNVNKEGYSNVFRTALQFDILLSAGWKYKNFFIAGGLNQFFYETTQPRNGLVYGGPFAQIGFDF